MQRVIGAVLILTATAGAGYMYGRDLKEYLRKMIYLRYVFGLIRGEISYTSAPLPEIFFSIGEKIREPYGLWLKMTARELEDREESGFTRAWNRCADRYLRGLGLKYEHMILIKEPGTFLGSLQKDTLDHTLQLYLNRMDLEIEKLRDGLAAKVRVGSCLGVMSGIFLIVILL
ncbi:stage III sporulation protein AB [Ruminococcus sp. CLA-AA-H200]|uniref:Stage III sporulation protein AB n=1 Tax=Ruminococcus turbiniformis TaxID=2881258 RepID=A0ABS8FTZ1_9FIRM|nr:stage III sporulation protein AB [Ruminococcus turbiniformis]MCC2253485.1 stage III sporulation protein AB [Ruminococcus turbiniformis]